VSDQALPHRSTLTRPAPVPHDRSHPSRLRSLAGLALALSVAVPVLVAPASASADASPGATQSSATPGGPRPTSIRLAPDDASTTVLVHGLGSAADAQAREHRSLRHSDLQPTARFASAGDRITVEVPDGAPAMSVSIGLHGPYAAHNGDTGRPFSTTALHTGENVVEAPIDGMVFLVSTVDGGSADVEVSGGQPVPHLVVGQTTNEQLIAEMRRLPDAPFVSLIGERVLADLQAPKTGSLLPGIDVAARVEHWDDVVELANETHGLRDDATGSARKAPHRIYFAMPDRGGGWGGAAQGHLAFQVSSGAAREVLTASPEALWGLWHEIGHSYQTPTYNWGGLGEVLVNVWSLNIQSELGFGNRLDGMLGDYDAHFAKPVDERSFDLGLWGKLMMFDQLRRAFGTDFWPRLNQEARVASVLAEDRGGATNDGRQQHFIVAASRVADRDLGEFFREWGIPPTAETAAALEGLPDLDQPIWLNRLSTDLVHEYDVESYGVPTGSVDAVTERVTVGRTQLATPPTIASSGGTDGSGGTRVVGHTVDARSVGTGSVHVEVIGDRGVREVLSTTVDVTQGELVQARGISERTVFELALDGQASVVRVLPGTTYASHSHFGATEYVGAALLDGLGRVRADLSVAGRDNAHAAVAAFGAPTYRDGDLVQIRHREARTRLDWWTGDEVQPRDASATRLYRIVDHRLVPIDDVEPIRADTVVAPVVLHRGTTAPVTVALATTTEIDSLTGELSLEAPSSTRFDDGPLELVTEVRLPDGEWRRFDAVVADGLRLSAGGTRLTADVSNTGDLDLPVGARLRWTAQVVVPAEARLGTSALGWSLVGQADRRLLDVRG
jgi:hypothetical protein